LLSAIVFSLYVAIFIYDLRHKIIPNKLVYPAILTALIFRIIFGGQLLDFLSGPMMFAFFGFIWFISRGRAMGFGDAKLALSIGLLLGGAMGLSAFVLSFWIGSVVAIFIMIVSRILNARNSVFLKRAKRLTMKSEIPFAPFLIIGAWASLIFHLDLLHVLAFI
jgi:prepilin signal peptidase PulO-like enzyme (type II secretory pathway)